jgi:hypothetical protein
MADFTLSDGRKVDFDLYALSYDEYLAFFDAKQSDSEAKEVLARVCGMEFEEFGKIPFADYRLLTKAFFEKARQPIDDPN